MTGLSLRRRFAYVYPWSRHRVLFFSCFQLLSLPSLFVIVCYAESDVQQKEVVYLQPNSRQDTGKTLCPDPHSSNTPGTMGYFYWRKWVSGLNDVLKSTCELLIIRQQKSNGMPMLRINVTVVFKWRNLFSKRSENWEILRNTDSVTSN